MIMISTWIEKRWMTCLHFLPLLKNEAKISQKSPLT